MTVAMARRQWAIGVVFAIVLLFQTVKADWVDDANRSPAAEDYVDLNNGLVFRYDPDTNILSPTAQQAIHPYIAFVDGGVQGHESGCAGYFCPWVDVRTTECHAMHMKIYYTPFGWGHDWGYRYVPFPQSETCLFQQLTFCDCSTEYTPPSDRIEYEPKTGYARFDFFIRDQLWLQRNGTYDAR